MADWDNVQAWDKLNRAQELLEKTRMDKLESTKNAMVAKWILVGNRCFQEFLEFHKVHRPFIYDQKVVKWWANY
jgi:hypothetical protein